MRKNSVLNEVILQKNKCKKGVNGITLIALIITIIVLLILAGVTINTISGSESAPAKANEAGQKNDIGAAKDDISLTVTNAKMQGMETAYVGNGVSASEASTTVGIEVIKAVAQKYQTNNKIGNATISVDVPKTNNIISDDATITIWTTDFSVDGTITLNDGVLTWDEIGANTPQIIGVPNNLTLAPGDTTTLRARLKGTTGNIEWNSNKLNVATVENGVVEILDDVADKAEVEITASFRNLSATCTIKVEKPKTIGDPINADKYGYKVKRAKYENGQIVRDGENNIVYENYITPAESISAKGWRLFYQDNKNTYLIYDSKTLNISLNTDEIKAYKGTDVSQVGKDLNPLLVEKNPSLLETSTPDTTNDNIKALAWLTDTSDGGPWSTYKGPDAKYAIGSPSIELLKASWDATRIANNVNSTISCEFKTGQNGYDASCNSYTLAATYNQGIYGKGNWDVWICSPNVRGTSYMCYRVEGAIISNTVSKKYGLRPIICIPTNLVNKSNSTEQKDDYLFVNE